MTELKVPTLTMFGMGALGLLMVFSAAPGTTGHPARRTATANAYPRLPITFVENRGQTDQQVRYFAQGPRYAFFLTRNEVVLSLARSSLTRVQGTQIGNRAFLINASSKNEVAQRPSSQGIVLGLQFLGANSGVVVDGAERAPGNMNYFRGDNPADWRTDLPSYAQVVYHELWPGVDLRVRAKAGALKYEFSVRPGARIDDIRLAYRGADRIALDSTGVC